MVKAAAVIRTFSGEHKYVSLQITATVDEPEDKCLLRLTFVKKKCDIVAERDYIWCFDGMDKYYASHKIKLLLCDVVHFVVIELNKRHC